MSLECHMMLYLAISCKICVPSFLKYSDRRNAIKRFLGDSDKVLMTKTNLEQLKFN